MGFTNVIVRYANVTNVNWFINRVESLIKIETGYFIEVLYNMLGLTSL